MVLFRHVAKRMLRKKGLWVFTFVAMFGFALVLSFFNSTSTLSASIGILDRDGGIIAERLIAEAERFGPVTRLETTAEEDTFLEGQDIVLVIPERFTDSMFQGETPRLSFSATEGSDAALIEQALNAHLSRERQLIIASGYDETGFQTLADRETERGYIVSSEPFQESVTTTARTQAFLGLLSFVMMSAFLQFIPLFVADDRDESIYSRLFAAPITPRRYVGSLALSFFAVGLFYVLMLLAFSAVLYADDIIEHLPVLSLLFIAYLGSCLAIGALIAVAASNREKANIWQISVTMAAAITGGAFIALAWLPDSLKVVGRLLPTYWFNAGVADMYAGKFPLLSLAVLVAMTGVLFTVTVLFLKKKPLTT